ncbi:serine/threonine-protein kinase [Belnapia moabensis]|uniref:serine/threonine-protein kinase n=1 Tax=Belnapia moabensis TaxID=365533 RepID=UPI0005BCF76E|nr:serine/threonine-protein kinase [Belnapia moabensis]
MAPEPSEFAEIGRYRPQAVLGAGAMGVVYRASDPLLDRQVAVKVMRTAGLDPDQHAEYMARFTIEAKAAGRCSHPSIIMVHDFGDGADGPFLVMELVNGPTLAALLRRPRSCETVTLIALLLPVLEGLGAAHAHGIVHRDIKPANIIVAGPPDAPMQPKIADFGVARLPAGARTLAGDMLGTPNYMAPEQALGDQVDHRADVFSVAAILHEILLERPPFAAPSLVETLQRLTGPAAVDLAALAGSPMRPVLQRGLAKSPADRPATAVEFAAEIRAALTLMQEHTLQAEHATVVLRPGSDPLGPGPQGWASEAALHAAPSRFDPLFTSRLADELRPVLGPIATTLVRRAAARANTPDELVRQVAAALEQPADRSAFLRRHMLGPGTATPSGQDPLSLTPARTSGSAGAASATGASWSRSPDSAAGLRLEWSDVVLTVAQAALAFHLGPMAKVFVRQALRDAQDIDSLLDRLAAHLPDPRQIPAFRRQLRAEIEAKLRPTA